jgi:uncharacterized damage-inducible protein DinB
MPLSPIERLRQAVRYNAWANATMHTALSASSAPEAALRALQHVLETEVTWSGRILGREDAYIPQWQQLSREKIDTWLVQARRELGQVAADSDVLDRQFTYRNSAGKAFTDDIAVVLDHLLLHSAQYRGEAAGFANAAGVRVPDLDYIFWVRAGAPESP